MTDCYNSFIYNGKNKQNAKNLRRNMTEQERKLWYLFLKDYPIKFYKQRTINDYIVDFYCAKARLVIELDGSGHFESDQIEADRKRTKELSSMNLFVYRIPNPEIDRNFPGVCEAIDALVRERTRQPSLTAGNTNGR